MLKKPLFWEMFVLLAIVGILNYIATIYHLYWATSEFDSVVHFFGGTAISTFFLWLYFFSGFFNPQKRSLGKFLLVSILGSMFVAISWEVYELILGEAKMQKTEYPYDTTLDLIMDLLGILGAFFYGYMKELENRKSVDIK